MLLATFALLFVSLPTTSQRLGETACAPGSFATDDLNQCGGGQPAGSGLQRAAESVIVSRRKASIRSAVLTEAALACMHAHIRALG